ncbi:putative hydroxypyruvate reductase [mine drainage metagenome]|uniref:Putative hydroxypyruvate reductase n=1 Tax=mine drainage metagenome TaxID=410659 RepID=A0A1J5RT07_9ZZZZ
MTAPVSLPPPRAFLLDLFHAALAAADPARTLAAHLPPRPKGRTVVVGAGKAAAAMAAALEACWDGPLSGLVICPYGYGLPTGRIAVAEAGHPVPDAAGFRAATRMLAQLEGLGAEDLVIALISGGGSALMALPAPGLTLDDKQAVTRGLLLSGASIAEINCLRKHLSAVKGGRLALAAWPAPIHALVVSDVPGDDPAVIASGPTVADPTTAREALEIVRKYRLDIPFAVIQFLKRQTEDTPKAGDPRLARSSLAIITRPAESLLAAAEAARRAGVTPVVLGDAIEGESREVARALAGMALSAARLGLPAAPPCVLLSGGETTVTVRGRGQGGPNGEFALALALALKGRNNISAIACDTDGMDGASGAAGALVLPDSLERARAKGIDVAALLAQNDSSGLFAPLGDLVQTGPTRTNVNDFRAIFIAEPTQ